MTEITRINIATSTLLRIVVIAAGLWLLYVVRDMVVMLFASVIVAAAIEPLARRWEKYRIPRALTVILVYVVLLLAVIGVGALMINPLVRQTRELAHSVPETLNQLSEFTTLLPQYNQQAVVSAVQNGLVNFGDNLANISANVFRSTRTFINILVNFLFVFVIALYLVVEERALVKLARAFTPRRHMPLVERAMVKVQRDLGRWVLAQLALGMIVGSIVGIGLWLFGVPYALLLAILAGVLEFVPVIGPLLSSIPGIIVALSQSWTLGLGVWIFYLVVGQVESHVLIPNIMRRAVGLKPLVTIVAVLVGARLLGFVGILLAVPIATVVMTFWAAYKEAVEVEEVIT